MVQVFKQAIISLALCNRQKPHRSTVQHYYVVSSLEAK
jgi:hypothetical protein